MQYVLSLSYGKDSLACLEAIKLLGLPLDRIIHAEVWATDTIPADLPPMVEFKAKADAIIKERYGITVEHISAVERERRLSYERQFYKRFNSGKRAGEIYGFPMLRGAWCNSNLKINALSAIAKTDIRKTVLPPIGVENEEKFPVERHLRISSTEKPLVQFKIEDADSRQSEKVQRVFRQLPCTRS